MLKKTYDMAEDWNGDGWLYSRWLSRVVKPGENKLDTIGQ